MNDSLQSFNSPPYGATKSDWAHFDLVLGLTEDLLPVVSNPNAKISPLSKMVGLGKTPSRYNKDGHAVGIPDWTQQRTTPSQIANWQREPDYGICVQTRHLRALDIDIDDPIKAALVTDIIKFAMGKFVPTRRRDNSGKCLLAFHVEGDLGKRTMKVDGGIVEFLATGQQFIAVGTHPSGVPYRWDPGLPSDFPTLMLDEFNELWEKLALVYAIEDPTEGKAAIQRNQTKDQRHDDWVSDYLRDSLWYRGDDTDGRVYIFCPWEKGHSGDSGDSETVYFPQGSNGFATSAFKCLHASCAKRTDGDFLAATGAGADGFEVLPPLVATPSLPMTISAPTSDDYPVGIPIDSGRERGVLPNLDRKVTGEIRATLDNVIKVLACDDIIGFRIVHDRFSDEIVFGDDANGWQLFRDGDYTQLRLILHSIGFSPVSKEMVRDAMLRIVQCNQIDSAKTWLSMREWDGTPRVKSFMVRYMGAEDTPYALEMSSYIWTGLAGRILDPGCQADIIPVWVSGQGTKKSSAVAAMAPHRDQFVEVDMHEKDADLSRKMRGKVIGEIAELRGLRTKEIESIKAWVTRRYEEFIPKYREYATKFPRRLIFIGTTNAEEFLADETGNRRFAPIRVTGGDVDAIARDREQLWAEAAAMWTAGGIQWRELERLAMREHDQFTVSDPWVEQVATWLRKADVLTGRVPGHDEFLRMNEVFDEALKMEPRMVRPIDESRLGKVLRELNYEKASRRIEGIKTKVWVSHLI